MKSQLYLILPLMSAIIYTFAAMLFKKLIQNNVNLWYINFIANIATCLLITPLYIISSQQGIPIPILPPLIVGMLFILGQAFSLIALKQGDVSVATPLLGTKVIMVAFFTLIILGINVPLLSWIASILAVLALLLLRGNSTKSKKIFVPTVIYSLLCAACFALSDILIQKWAPTYGPDRFIFMVFLLVAICSFGFIPLFIKDKLTFKAEVSHVFIASIVAIAIQTILMAIALSRFGNATAINIVFSSRTVWSVLLVWWFGKYLQNDERLLGKKIFWERLAGSTLILIAIALVMIKP